MGIESNPLVLSAVSVFLVSIVSLAGIFALLLTGKFLHRIIFVLVSLSVGVLFGDVFIHIIPEIFGFSTAFLNPSTASLFILGGIALFFALEKFFRWGHGHSHHRHTMYEVKEHKSARMPNTALGNIVLFADGVHNFIDGMIITASFLVSRDIGFATVLAVLLHELPQEIGDFGVLLHAGYSKGKALLYNFLSALAAFAGFAVTLIAGRAIEEFTHIALAIAAGGFIYIAGSDLVPELHKLKSFKKSFLQFSAILAGFALMFLLLELE